MLWYLQLSSSDVLGTLQVQAAEHCQGSAVTDSDSEDLLLASRALKDQGTAGVLVVEDNIIYLK